MWNKPPSELSQFEAVVQLFEQRLGIPSGLDLGLYLVDKPDFQFPDLSPSVGIEVTVSTDELTMRAAHIARTKVLGSGHSISTTGFRDTGDPVKNDELLNRLVVPGAGHGWETNMAKTEFENMLAEVDLKVKKFADFKRFDVNALLITKVYNTDFTRMVANEITDLIRNAVNQGRFQDLPFNPIVYRFGSMCWWITPEGVRADHNPDFEGR